MFFVIVVSSLFYKLTLCIILFALSNNDQLTITQDLCTLYIVVSHIVGLYILNVSRRFRFVPEEEA